MAFQKKKNYKLSTQAALSKVQFICSKQEKCCSEIRKKLKDWQISADEQEEIIDSLIDDKFIDENRYTKFYVRDKFRFNRWGRIKIHYHLKQKQIPEKIIQEAMEQIPEEEYRQILLELIQSKQKSLKDEDKYQLKSKLYRFAQSRGYESDLTLKQIDLVLSEKKV